MITRRSLLGSMGMSASTAASALPARASASRPNLVLFVSDDHGYFDSPVYGSNEVQAPNIQALARDGMTFRGVFTGSPTCVPSRAVLMSGLLPARNGALPNHSGLTPGIRTLPSFLKNTGYEVFHFGKSHFQPAANYPDWQPVPSEIRRGPLDSDLDTAAVEKWLENRATRKNAAPVCLVVCSHSPHVYWRESSGYDPSKVTLPPAFVDTPETRAARARYYTDITKADQQLGDVCRSCRKHLSSNTLFIYTSDNGAQWPFAKWSLYDAGIHMPFLAAWPGVIRPGSSCDALVSFCDVMPTFIELAGGKVPSDIDGRSFVHLLTGDSKHHRTEIFAAHSGDRDFNVYPMRCARSERFKYILNLHPEFKYTTHIDKAGELDGRDYFDSWVRKAKTDEAAAAVVRRYHDHPPEELYDVSQDPHEMRNLAADPRHQKQLADLRGRVRQWMRDQGDEGKVFGNPTMKG